MAMIDCSECGHSVSNKAAACPACGALIASKPSAVKKLFAVVVALGFGLVAALVTVVVFVMNGHAGNALPALIAFVFGAAAGWFRAMR